jgi:hypothetical protein
VGMSATSISSVGQVLVARILTMQYLELDGQRVGANLEDREA